MQLLGIDLPCDGGRRGVTEERCDGGKVVEAANAAVQLNLTGSPTQIAPTDTTHRRHSPSRSRSHSLNDFEASVLSAAVFESCTMVAG